MRAGRTITAAAALLLLTGTMAMADPAGKDQPAQRGHMVVHSSAMTRGHSSMMGHGCHDWKKTLDRSQREKIDAMHLALKREMAPLAAELALRKAELRNLVTSTRPDQGAMKRKIKEISALREKMMTRRYMHILQMRKVLNPRQRRSFDMELLSGRGHWRSHMRD